MDRDGVLNEAIVRDGLPFPPPRLNDLRLIPGVLQACRDLRLAGLMLFCVTNQPDVARGSTRLEDVEAINREIRLGLGLDEVAACFHDDVHHCECRKPKPGMLISLAQNYQVDLTQSFMVGDRWRDIEAGRRAGCRTIFIDNAYRERRPARPDLICSSLAEAAAWILREFEAGALIP